jgi:hypothetical protein
MLAAGGYGRMWGMRARIPLAIFTACAGLLLAVLAIPAQAAIQPTAAALPDTCAAVRAQAQQLAPAGNQRVGCIERAAAAPGSSASPDQISICPYDQWLADRFDMCITGSYYYTIYTLDPESGNWILTGEIDFTLEQDISLSAVTATFAENDVLIVSSASGDATSGTTIAFSASCGGSCTATSHFATSPLVADETLTGSVSYSDSTTTVDSTQSSYTMTAYNPVAVNGPQSLTWDSLTYRCDDEVAAYPGCVVPSYTPYLTTMTSLPAIAANIASIQAAGPHHYGSPNYAPAYPLHRTTNWTIINANNRIACPQKLKPLDPSAYIPPSGSCDEYPFATTMEGASQTAKPDWGTALVPPAQQNSQGGYISSFYQSNRILDGDAFWVVV